MKNKTQERILSLTPISVMCCYLSMMQCEGFTATTTIRSSVPFIKKQSIVNNGINNNSIESYKFKSQTQIYLQAPPGLGYVAEEEGSEYPDTYEPMMEYPGTMRPGRTPENQPYSSLPIQESDPDPVPWPHFQEIEWHHNWGSPHEHPIPMEEFIDMHGRWATAEMEAEMRAGARRGVRERRELEEAQKAASFILDDDEDDEDDDGENSGPQLDLGEGVDALIGAGAAAAATISKSATKDDTSNAQLADDDDDDDNFLLDLGLDETGDDEDEDEDEGEIGDDGEEPAFSTGDDSTEGILEAMQSMIDAEDDTEVATDGDDNEIDIDFDDLGLNFDDDDDDDDVSEGDDDDEFVVMDDDDISMENEDLTLDEMVGNEDMGADDEFDDGGFDYD